MSSKTLRARFLKYSSEVPSNSMKSRVSSLMTIILPRFAIFISSKTTATTSVRPSYDCIFSFCSYNCAYTDSTSFCSFICSFTITKAACSDVNSCCTSSIVAARSPYAMFCYMSINFMSITFTGSTACTRASARGSTQWWRSCTRRTPGTSSSWTRSRPSTRCGPCRCPPAAGPAVESLIQ